MGARRENKFLGYLRVGLFLAVKGFGEITFKLNTKESHITILEITSKFKLNKGFSNKDITILSMNKTQKYLRY